MNPLIGDICIRWTILIMVIFILIMNCISVLNWNTKDKMVYLMGCIPAHILILFSIFFPIIGQVSQFQKLSSIDPTLELNITIYTIESIVYFSTCISVLIGYYLLLPFVFSKKANKI